MEPAEISSRRFRSTFVLVLVILTMLLFLTVIWPLMKPLFVGAVFAGLSMPVYKWFVKITHNWQKTSATATLAVILLIILGPLAAIFGLIFQQAKGLSESFMPWVRENLGPEAAFDLSESLRNTFPWMGGMIPEREQIVEMVQQSAEAIGNYFVTNLSAITFGTIEFAVQVFVTFFATFFFLMDGHQLVRRIMYYTPLGDAEEKTIIGRFASITRATVKGTLLIGLIQGTTAGIAFFVAGIQGAAFWGFVMVVFSIIPGIGAPIVWVPAVTYLFAAGETVPAVALLLWCLIVVSSIDEFLRPILVGKDAQMPQLLILVGTLGGLYLFGIVGFMVGPIVCGIFLTSLDIYASAFRNVLPPVNGRRPEAMTGIDITGTDGNESGQKTTPTAK